MKSGKCFGAVVFSRKLDGIGGEHPYDPIIRVLRSDAGQMISTFQCTMDGFSATVLVKSVTGDIEADHAAMLDQLDAAWRGVPIDKLKDVRRAEYESKKALRSQLV